MKATLRRISWLAAAGFAAVILWAATSNPPATRIEVVTDVVHGVEIKDPYRWLENQESPETRAWIEAQTRYARPLLDAIPGRDKVRDSLNRLNRIDTYNVPLLRNGRYFFTRRLATEDRYSICRRAGPNEKDEVLIDPKTISADETVSINIEHVAEDASLLAYGIRQGGQDEREIRILDLNIRQELPDRLPAARYFGFRIRHDKAGFYYSRFRLPEGSRAYYHQFGSDSAKDAEIFGRGYGPTQNVGINLSEDGRYLVFTVGHGVPPKKVEVYIQDLVKPGPIRPVVTDVEAEFRPAVHGDMVYLWTNWKASNWRILGAPLDANSPDAWKEIVPESKVPVSGVTYAGGAIFVNYLETVSTRIKRFSAAGRYLSDFPLPGIGSGTVAGRWQEDEAFSRFSSFAQPGTISRHLLSTGKQEVWYQPKIPVNPDEIETRQVWFRSKDGTQVPMFIVHCKGLQLNGGNPTLLFGYGGFNISETPSFNANVAAWLSMGGVYAVANLRGGGEFGEEWHRAGMFEKKQNVFDDFIAAAEWLIAQRYTNPEKLAIRGGSNGGLLVGAALTQRPELFRAVDCGVPLLDMIRYHKLSVGAWWAAEYGSSDDPRQFSYLLKYSPYHNVKQGVKYPAVIFVTGDSDTRVDPSHARKMTALLQASSTSGRPILLRYEAKGGHSGIGSLEKSIEQSVDELSFLAWQLGMSVN